MNSDHKQSKCGVAVIWIDWYPYHVARFRGLESVPSFAGRAAGIELVGGVGVHAGLKFREELPAELAVETLMPGRSWKDANKLKLSVALWHKLSALDPEVLLVPGYYTLPAVAAAVWARVHGRASVLMTESCAMDHARSGWKERVKGFGMRMLFGWAVCGGGLHVQYLRDLGFPADRIAGCYDVVDNELFRQGTASLRARSEPSAWGLPAGPYFLYVGRLAEEKNVGGLLRSWFAYRSAGGTWPLVLVGDGPKKAALKAFASGSQFASEVLFPGLKSSQELIPYYAFAGCFVLPSRREPWGLVVNEAMAAGLPVLVSQRCGCAADLVISGKNGWVFDPEDQGELQALLTRVAELEATQRDEMGRTSAEIVQAFSPERFGRSVESIASAADGQSATLNSAAGEVRG